MMKNYIFTAFVIASLGVIAVTELNPTHPLSGLIAGLVCLVFSVDCIVQAVKEYKRTKIKKP